MYISVFPTSLDKYDKKSKHVSVTEVRKKMLSCLANTHKIKLPKMQVSINKHIKKIYGVL